MASTLAASPAVPSGEESAKDFHFFPDLPAELRVLIWQMAYDAIPDTLVYRFGLRFLFPDDLVKCDDGENARVPHAILEPLEEVGFLTRELRSLRRVNTESRHEGERLFDGYLRLNQTEQGDTTNFCPPINLPWKGQRNFFCFVGLSEYDVGCLCEANTDLIAQTFTDVQMLGLDVNRELDDGITDSDDYTDFAEFILRFPKVQAVALVSDLLMTEADLYNIDDEIRSIYFFQCWDDWVGRVHEDIIGFHCEDPKITTKEQHLDTMRQFADALIGHASTFALANKLFGVAMGMIFRTQEDLNYLLLDDETLGQLLPNDLFDDEFSNEISQESSEGFAGL